MTDDARQDTGTVGWPFLTPEQVEETKARFLEAQKSGQIRVLPPEPPQRPASLAEALAVLQTRLPDIKKGTEGQVGTRKYAYADLADVSKALLPELGKVGLSFSAKPTWVTRDDGTREFVLLYTLRHTSGEEDWGEYPLVGASGIGNHQAIGSAITYGRRYTLCAITGAVADEDDDGNTAGPPVSELIERQRAMRRKDPEVDEHGAATIAEQTRMITGPEPGTTRLATTPPDDPWYDQPAGQLPVPSAQPLERQIIVHFNRLGIGAQNRDERLQITALLAGRTDVISSTKQLTDQQRVDVKETLAHCRDRAALDQLLDALEAPAAQPAPDSPPGAAPQAKRPGPAGQEGTAGPGHQETT